MSTSDGKADSGGTLAEAIDFMAGFRRVEAELQALTELELAPVNLEVRNVVATVLSALPGLRALRAQAARLPDFDLGRFDKLRDYALALGYAHAACRVAAGPAASITELAARATALRDVLKADAMALAKRRILDGARIAKLRTGVGYKNLVFELAGLIGLFHNHWADIQTRCALTLEELEHAAKVAQELATAVGIRDRAPAVAEAAASVRQRAFTLLLRAYDDARRAVTYLRWHDCDAENIAPSLYAGRHRSANGYSVGGPAKSG